MDKKLLEKYAEQIRIGGSGRIEEELEPFLSKALGGRTQLRAGDKEVFMDYIQAETSKYRIFNLFGPGDAPTHDGRTGYDPASQPGRYAVDLPQRKGGSRSGVRFRGARCAGTMVAKS